MFRKRGLGGASAIALTFTITAGLLACSGRPGSPAPGTAQSSAGTGTQGPAGTDYVPIAEATPTLRPVPTPVELNDSLGSPVLSTPGSTAGSTWVGLKFSSVAGQLDVLPGPTDLGRPRSPVFDPPVRWSGGWVTSWQTTEEHDGRWLALVSPDGATWFAVWAPGRPMPGGAGLIVYADSSHAYTSADGVKWTLRDVSGLDGWAAGESPRISCQLGLLAASASSLSTGDVFFSADGLSWTRARLPVVAGSSIARVDLACSASRLIAIGWKTAADGTTSPAAFWSADGTTWQRGVSPVGPAYGPVLAARNGFIAFARWDRWLWSADGASWSEVDTFGPLRKKIGDLLLDEPHANGERFLARARDGRMWTSFDGRTWTALSGIAPMEAPSDAPRNYLALWPRGVMYEDGRSENPHIEYGASY